MPEPKQLFVFRRAAVRAGRHDLVGVFEAALQQAVGLGWTIPPDVQGLALLWDLMKLPPRDEFEWEAAQTMLSCLRGLKPAEAMIDALCAANPERAQWFQEKALLRNLVKPKESERSSAIAQRGGPTRARRRARSVGLKHGSEIDCERF